jgi:hypothetical protein
MIHTDADFPIVGQGEHEWRKAKQTATAASLR